MQEQYTKAIEHLEQAQQELRALLEPSKTAEQVSLHVIILSMDSIKRRINDYRKDVENDRI